MVSIALLADDRPNWRPETYEMGLWGCEVRFRFPTAKLLDFRERLAELEANRNPVAALVLAHLAAQRTHSDLTRRLREKLALTGRLYDLGYSPEQVRMAFRFVDWRVEPATQVENPIRAQVARLRGEAPDDLHHQY